MKPILAVEQSSVLSQLMHSQALLAFDFDGTLAPIVADRESAHMRPRTKTLLTELCERYPCAVISGRARDDVAQRVSFARVQHIIGNHGMEAPQSVLAWREEMQEVRRHLQSALALVPGIDVEDKSFSLTIHYRRAMAKRGARAAIHSALVALPVRMRAVPGKLVVNIVPLDAPHKGDALRALMRDTNRPVALYVGDDVTDEDVFLLNPNPGIVGVRVGTSKASAASYFLRDQREVDTLLARLLEQPTHVAIDP